MAITPLPRIKAQFHQGISRLPSMDPSFWQLWELTYIYIREGNGTPLQYSCLENPMDRGACLAAIHGVAKSRT